ncbi:MAG: haloacid dehalogenase, partial [Proteobacteria bacterium]|nr:haloacid dehalogenase [Pseudomonadota bacterium]
GDGTCAPHIASFLPQGTPIVMADIDGTLTISDAELMTQISDGTYDPVAYAGSTELLNTWADKGYRVFYLTARPHLLRSETRLWLTSHGYPDGVVITAPTLVFSDSAVVYKRTWVERIINDFGWDIAAVYGNANSDIDAYEEAGVSKDITFVIGEYAGTSNTQAIVGDDYTSHIANYVEAQPDVD